MLARDPDIPCEAVVAHERDVSRSRGRLRMAHLGSRRPNVGRIEKELDVRLSSLERYVEALGGKLEIHAVFDDADTKLTA